MKKRSLEENNVNESMGCGNVENNYHAREESSAKRAKPPHMQALKYISGNNLTLRAKSKGW